MKRKYCVIYDEPYPISNLGDWEALAESNDLILGHSLFGDFFLMDSSTKQISLLYTMPPELVETQFFGIESFLNDCVEHPVIREDLLNENKVDELINAIGDLKSGQVYIPEPYPFLGGDLSIKSYSKGDLSTFLSIIADLQLS